MFCKECDKEVETMIEDHGIGHWEFGGASGVDRKLAHTCQECGNPIEPADPPRHRRSVGGDDERDIDDYYAARDARHESRIGGW